MPIKHRVNMRKTALAALTALYLSGCANDETSVTQQQTSAWPELSSPVAYADADKAFVAELIARMSVEQKVGQILQAEIQTITPQEARDYHIGSILNGGGSIPNRNPEATAKDWADFAEAFYQASVDDELAIPVIWGTDAVHGHGNLEGATIFPHNIALGAANNPALMEQIGRVTAKEVRATGIEWVFAPTVAVARNDRWGRTYESYSEDPNIVANLAKPLIIGLQGQPGTESFLDEHHVLATVKHFLGDGGTTNGDDQGDAQISETELANIHAPGYYSTIEAGALSVMASFNSWNGIKMHGNEYLLTDVLRGELGFPGFVVGDWNGHGQVPDCTNDHCPQSVNAGLDLYMVPYDWKSMYQKTLDDVKAGAISMQTLDKAVERVLLAKKVIGLFEGKSPLQRAYAGDNSVIGKAEHREVARQAVRESLVLLKNNGQILPINPNSHVLVTGDGAENLSKQAGGWTVTWQGTGTQPEDYAGATSIFSGIEQAVTSQGGSAELSLDGSFQQKPDVAVVVFGEDPYAEGQGDVNTLEFEPGVKPSLELIRSLQAQGIKVVSVFLSGRPLWVNQYINASDAFVAAWLPGSEGAGVADVIIGNAAGQPRFDFAGKLSFSWPKEPLQANVNWGDDDYQPQFPFGYGLTYQDKVELETLVEDVPGIEQPGVKDIDLYVGRPLEPWRAYIRNFEKDQFLSGAFAQLQDETMTARTIDKDVQEDALLLNFQNHWNTGLFMSDGSLDLSEHVKKGTLELDMRVDSIQKGTVDLLVECRVNCRNAYLLRDWALEHEGKGWQRLSIPLNCLLDEEADLTQLRRPFELRTGGDGQLAIANIRYTVEGEANMSCQENLSTTPDTLHEYWAVDWWMPRHEQKVAQANLGEAKLVMIGDSITNSWEDKGKAVWQDYFGDVNTLNLGFGGDRTENVLWRLQHGTLGKVKPDLAVMMIGTNNTGHRLDTPEDIRDGVAAILDELDKQIPDTPVLLLAIFPRSETPDDTLRVNNEQTNVLLKQLAQQRGIMFDNFNQAFLTENGVLTREIMPDLLHPEHDGYVLWAEQLQPYVDKFVRKGNR